MTKYRRYSNHKDRDTAIWFTETLAKLGLYLHPKDVLITHGIEVI